MTLLELIFRIVDANLLVLTSGLFDDKDCQTIGWWYWEIKFYDDEHIGSESEKIGKKVLLKVLKKVKLPKKVLKAYLLVVITFSKADAERLRLIKRELRLTSDYYKSD